MGFAPVVTAALIGGGAQVGTSLLNRRGGGGGDQSELIREQLATARQMRSQGESLFSTGSPLLKQASSYYSKLLGGDPRAMREAVAPEASGIRESFLGAERGINAGPLRGGQRDYAQAELARTKAGKLGDLIPAARRAAAEGGGALGLSAAGGGTSAVGGASSAFGQLAGHGENARQFNARNLGDTTEAFGETLASGLQAKGGGGKKVSTGGTTSLLPTGGGSSPYGPPRVSGLVEPR